MRGEKSEERKENVSVQEKECARECERVRVRKEEEKDTLLAFDEILIIYIKY